MGPVFGSQAITAKVAILLAQELAAAMMPVDGSLQARPRKEKERVVEKT
jgi:hypothetical protein